MGVCTLRDPLLRAPKKPVPHAREDRDATGVHTADLKTIEAARRYRFYVVFRIFTRIAQIGKSIQST